MMQQQIEQIVNVSKNLRITCNQSLFLLAYKCGIYTVDLPGDELLELVHKGFMVGNRVKPETLDKLERALENSNIKQKEEAEKNHNYPILTQDTGQLCKRLAKHFLVNGISSKDFERLTAYDKNPIAIPFLYIFLEMFPTADSKKNKVWKNHFKGENASGVTLRRMSVGTSKKFKKIWK